MNTDSILEAANTIAANAMALFQTSTIRGEFPDPADKAKYLEEKALVQALHILHCHLQMASKKIVAGAEHMDVLSSSKLTPSNISEDRRRTAKKAVNDLYDIARYLSGRDQQSASKNT